MLFGVDIASMVLGGETRHVTIFFSDLEGFSLIAETMSPEALMALMNEYLSEVVKGPDGKLMQKNIGKIDQVKDPCKENKVGPCATGS